MNFFKYYDPHNKKVKDDPIKSLTSFENKNYTILFSFYTIKIYVIFKLRKINYNNLHFIINFLIDGEIITHSEKVQVYCSKIMDFEVNYSQY